MEPATGRRFSGYDEYEGIFGPIGVYGASERHSHATIGGFSGSRAISGSSRKSSRRHANAPSRLASFRHAHSDLQSRAKYLDARRAKRKLQLFDMHAEEDSGREGGNPLVAPPPVSAAVPQPHGQRQVWLPTRNFSFRQRAGKLDMRAIARLDLQKIVATTDIDAIQRHLENLAFADVTIEDVQHYSDAYFLKLFQIAQLTLEYLLNVQDSLLTHSEGVETQCEELLGECQQLESENGVFEAEIASLKKEIRHKQRTMATFEIMLLNASVSRRRLPRASSTAGNKENAAAEANAIVDKLLGDDGAEGAEEDGVVNKPVDCVVCGKKFLSAEYLIRHQQRKHQSDAKRNKKKTRKKRSSGSSSSSSSDMKPKFKGVKTAPLPAEIIQALEEKNELARQLLALQEQLRAEKDARDQQSKLLEGQQSQLTAQVVDNMGKLQTMLLDIERKQETTKHDMMQYTQETIQRLQTEAANAQLLVNKKSSSSRAGTIQSDNEEEAVMSLSKRPKDGEWQETQLEKILEVFLKAQTQQQQEIDALAQENSKLLSKTKAKQRHRRHQNDESSSSLMHMAALDARRFGIDNGDLGREATSSTLPVQPVHKVVAQEDKLVQTDEEDDNSNRNRSKKVMTTHEVQTDTAVSEETPPQLVRIPPPAVQKHEPLRRSTVNVTSLTQPKSVPVIKPETAVVTPDAPPIPAAAQLPTNDLNADKEKKLQHAAQIVSKVALGFLARRTLQNPTNWLVTLPFAALESALSEHELSQLRETNPTSSRELVIEVESGMTANELRVAVARALSGANYQQPQQGEETGMEETLLVDYHRVLLHHIATREELHGDRPVHNFKNQIEVEIIPSYQEAEDHVEGVVEFHSDVTDRLREIRRASMELSEVDTNEAATEESQLQRLVRLQARVRGFLAKRKVAILRVDQLVEKRLVKMRSVVNKRQASSSGGQISDGILDPVVAAQCKRIHERLSAAVKSRLSDTSKRPSDVDRLKTKTSTVSGLSTAAYEQHSLILEIERSKLPSHVQSHIRSLSERLEQLVASEYDPQRAKTHEKRSEAAVKIQSAVQVAIARRRLQILLAGSKERDLPEAVETQELSTPRCSSSASASASSTPFSPLSALSSDDEPTVRRRPPQEDVNEDSKEDELEDFDAQEIAKLADAYEADEKLSHSIAISTAGGDEKLLPPAAERKDSPPMKDVELLGETRPAVVRRSVTRAPPVQPVLRPAADIPPRAATPIRHVEATAEPGRSPRPKLDTKEVISPFSKTPLLSRRSGPATRRGSGYDNAR